MARLRNGRCKGVGRWWVEIGFRMKYMYSIVIIQ